MGKALRGSAEDGRGGRGAVTRGARRLAALVAFAIAAVTPHARVGAQAAPERLDHGRFTVVFYPSDATLAHALVNDAARRDTFPGLPRPTERVLLAIAPDHRTFREWVGPGAPEWGAAITFPDSRRIVMEGRSLGAKAGDPRDVLRHELAHLALHEMLGDLPPRWFDEGYAAYAAHEWTREDALAANVALAVKGTPTFDELDAEFYEGSTTAENAYALAYRAVADLAQLDPVHGLSAFFAAWKREGDMNRAVRATYGITLAGFEQRWQAATRRRYGALAVVSDLSVAGLILVVLILPLYVLRRQRDRRRLAEMAAADEAAERAARSAAIEALLRGDEEGEIGGGAPREPAS
ncbi:MAG TPA: hypothetical protein VHB25_04050 [Gemmatimonadaceae bacterium]|nr:hypothetical protein [Gemmatimonadaceae bacterium]